MQIIQTKIPEVVIIEPQIFGDERGYFFESFSKNKFEKKVMRTEFVQDNESESTYGVLRGLHYQVPPYAQSKLVRVVVGKVLDVALDIRKSSPTFGKHLIVELSAENKRQLFIPRGFAHGFVVLSDKAIFAYKVDNIYDAASEASIRFDDPELNIDWTLKHDELKLSPKDIKAPLFKDAKLFE
jgi:dTDP-4-dehydrorhamnose 3,5-epimerase